MMVEKAYKQIENTKEETRKRVRQLLYDLYGYSDDNNPFGDPELSKPFHWQAKIEKLSKKGLNAQMDCDTLLGKLRKAKEEIERIRIKKIKREEERTLSKQVYNLAPDEKEDEELFEEWKKKDEKFYLAQEKLRMEIRIKEGREKPIDFLFKVIMIWKEIYPVPPEFWSVKEYQKPYLVFPILTLKGLNEIYTNIITQIAIEKERLMNNNFVCFYLDIQKNFNVQRDLTHKDIEEFIDYWSALLILCETYLNPEKDIRNINIEIKNSIDAIIKGKDFSELYDLENDVTKTLNEITSPSDIEYWTNVIKYVKYHRCIVVLDNLFSHIKDKREKEVEDTRKEKEMEKDIKQDSEEKDDNKKTNNTESNADYVYYDKLGNKIEINYYNRKGEYSPEEYASDEDINKIALPYDEYSKKIKDSRKRILINLVKAKIKSIDNLANKLNIDKLNVLKEAYGDCSKGNNENDNNTQVKEDRQSKVTQKYINNIKVKNQYKLNNRDYNNISKNNKNVKVTRLGTRLGSRRKKFCVIDNKNTKNNKYTRKNKIDERKVKNKSVIIESNDNNNNNSRLQEKNIELVIKENANNKDTNEILNNTIKQDANIPSMTYFQQYNSDSGSEDNSNNLSTSQINQKNNISNNIILRTDNKTITKDNCLDKSSESSESDSELEKFLGKKQKHSSQITSISQSNLYSTNKLSSNSNNILKNSRFYLIEENNHNNNDEEDINKEIALLESQELEDNEVILKEATQLTTPNNYTWATKYKPRKPRYFNRVKTGYEWNKYYQKHYDYDNPPPKVIQGYKFNIFYPDLIDKSKAPQYTIERSDIKDTCILRFSAGPPYEDISFNIVNREWDMNEKAGFKNYFDRGIYYLYFNFKRYRYRR